MRVLLVESVPEDVLFLREVLIESEADRHWGSWVHVEVLHAASWSEASALLASESVDAILLNPDLPESQGLETLRRVQAVAERVPVVVLTEDQRLSLRMIREGAQDFLSKQDIDCAPLAHAIQSAIERQRIVSAARASAIHDPLTGVLNRSAFLNAAERDRKLAQRLKCRMMLLIAEPNHAPVLEAQQRDLVLVEAADHLRSMAGATDTLGRIEESRFGLTVFEAEPETLEEAWARFHGAAEAHRMLVGAAMFDPDRSLSLELLLAQALADMRPTAAAPRAMRSVA